MCLLLSFSSAIPWLCSKKGCWRSSQTSTVMELLVICVKQKFQQYDMTDRPQRRQIPCIGSAGSAPTSAAGLLGDLELVHSLQHDVYKAEPIHPTSLEMGFELYWWKALCKSMGVLCYYCMDTLAWFYRDQFTTQAGREKELKPALVKGRFQNSYKKNARSLNPGVQSTGQDLKGLRE